MQAPKSIDLLPKVTEEEIQTIEKKGRINLFGVFFVLVIIVVSIVVLVGNLLAKMDHNNSIKKRSESEANVKELQYVELKQNTLNNKIATFSTVNSREFRAEVVLEYFMSVSEGLSTVDSLFVDDNLEFEVSGYAGSYSNVSRLWHDLASKEEIFEYVNLEYARTSSEGQIFFSFTGKMRRDSVDSM
ncbi:hypothetical protein JW710_00365 [Candidatus Dojkabacteria bacterium]|nr:hypothetical protein [Candidatus Dojkabacteria bacterium]